MSATRSPVRIAMWSGPRNISTAMMRSWGNRPDTFVFDEPFYAHYLQATGRDHGIPHAEIDLTLDDLYGADEMFCTGTMGELAGIIKLDGDGPNDR